MDSAPPKFPAVAKSSSPDCLSYAFPFLSAHWQPIAASLPFPRACIAFLYASTVTFIQSLPHHRLFRWHRRCGAPPHPPVGLHQVPPTDFYVWLIKQSVLKCAAAANLRYS